MNATRRKQIEAIYDKLTDLQSEIEMLKDEEQEYADNMPDNLQDSEKHEKAEETVGYLEEAYESIQSAMDSLESSKE